MFQCNRIKKKKKKKKTEKSRFLLLDRITCIPNCHGSLIHYIMNSENRFDVFEVQKRRTRVFYDTKYTTLFIHVHG